MHVLDVVSGALETGGDPAERPPGAHRKAAIMFVAFVVVTLITIAANAIESVANFMKADWVKRNSHAVGVPDSWLPFLGFVKGAAAVGLAVGFFWRPLGNAAAVGLVVFFVLALVLHVRERVFHNIAGPIGFLALSVATLWLMLAA
jgi:hypothetical protein